MKRGQQKFFRVYRDDTSNEYHLINVEAQHRLGMADIILQFKKGNAVLTGNVDVKATANDIPNSGKGPNITSFARIRTAYVQDPDFMFIILSIKHRVYSQRNKVTNLVDGTMEIVDYNAYDLRGHQLQSRARHRADSDQGHSLCYLSVQDNKANVQIA